MIPIGPILSAFELSLYLFSMFLVLFVLRVHGFGGPRIHKFSEAGHWLLIPGLSALHIITATASLSIQDPENTLASELGSVSDSVTPGLLLFALGTLLYRMNGKAPRKIISRPAFYFVYFLLALATCSAFLGQFNIVRGEIKLGDSEMKFGLLLYAGILVIETFILAYIVRNMQDLKFHPDQTIIYLTAQVIPFLFIRILHSIFKQFEVIPGAGSYPITFRFAMAVVMELAVASIFLFIGFIDHENFEGARFDEPITRTLEEDKVE